MFARGRPLVLPFPTEISRILGARPERLLVRTPARANDKLDRFLEASDGQPAALLRKRQMGYAGPASGLAEWLNDYVRAGCSHLVLHFPGEQEPLRFAACQCSGANF